MLLHDMIILSILVFFTDLYLSHLEESLYLEGGDVGSIGGVGGRRGKTVGARGFPVCDVTQNH